MIGIKTDGEVYISTWILKDFIRIDKLRINQTEKLRILKHHMS